MWWVKLVWTLPSLKKQLYSEYLRLSGDVLAVALEQTEKEIIYMYFVLTY